MDDDTPSVAQTKRDLDKALAALGDVEARLGAIREIVAGLGEGGYLLNLVDAAIADVRTLRTGGEPTER